MNIQIPQNWQDYELLDFGEGEKLERWGQYILRRPDKNAVGKKSLDEAEWNNIHLYFHRDSKNKEYWEVKQQVPEEWTVKYENLKFAIKPTKYKHTGLFPEQAINWEWIQEQIKKSKKVNPERKIKVLNLFAYTGGASVALAAAGADEVVHIDSSKGAISLAKENQKLSGLSEKNIRFIQEDVIKFVKKELKRGNKYDAIIMDPPLYGRGPEGELWKIEKHLPELLNLCDKILSDQPLFILINLYAGNNLSKKIIEKYPNQNTEKATIGLGSSKAKKTLNCGEVIRVTFS